MALRRGCSPGRSGLTSVALPRYLQEFDAFAAERNALAPASVGPVFHSSQFWTWMRTEQGLVDGMWTGLTLCFPVAFLVLCAATNNIILALYVASPRVLDAPASPALTGCAPCLSLAATLWCASPALSLLCWGPARTTSAGRWALPSPFPLSL